MDIGRIDKIIQYALLVAREEDNSFDRQLGPIHLIKYVYLADLDYAAIHDGETFTGVRWQFYKFGPWSQEVNYRIEPALLCISAKKLTFPSNYDDKDEWIRWIASDDDSFKEDLARELPFTIKSTLQRDVHRYGKDTAELLSYVYSTTPMLSAAPGEFLVFSKTTSQILSPEQSKDNNLSVKKQKILKANLQNLKMRHTKELSSKKKSHLVPPPRSARYDEVYFEGLKWLDSLAGEDIPKGNKDVIFSDSIWKSPSRSGDDFSD